MRRRFRAPARRRKDTNRIASSAIHQGIRGADLQNMTTRKASSARLPLGARFPNPRSHAAKPRGRRRTNACFRGHERPVIGFWMGVDLSKMLRLSHELRSRGLRGTWDQATDGHAASAPGPRLACSGFFGTPFRAKSLEKGATWRLPGRRDSSSSGSSLQFRDVPFSR